MRFPQKFPYTSINNINLDWIIKQVKRLTTIVENLDLDEVRQLLEGVVDDVAQALGLAESANTTAQAAQTTAQAAQTAATNAATTAQAAQTTADRKAEIHDNAIGTVTTWSSTKISNEIDKAKPAGVNENLLDNWYFVGGGSQQGYGYFPINQRRRTSYSNSGYCIDRWQTSGSLIKCQLTANGIVLNQNLFQNAVLFSQVSGQTITASVLTSAELVIVTTTLPTAEPTERTRFAGAGNTVEVYLDYDPASKTVQIVIFSSVDSTIRAAKLELSSTQTIAHQENGVWMLNEVPNYAEDLAKCQAYLLPLTPWLHFTGVIRTTTNVGVTIPTPVTMAKTPVFIGTISGGAIYKTDGQCTITGNGTPEIASLAPNAIRANVPISVVSGTLPSIMYSLVNAAFDYGGAAFLSAE